MTTNDQARSRNSRKRRALLASGLVLGVGAVITLAAWNDSVWGSSDFGTGENSWNVQGSVDAGATWAEFQTQEGAGGMAFTIDPEGMTPGHEVHALFGLKETEGNMGATVTVKAPITAGDTLAQNLTVTIVDLGATNPGSFDGTQTGTTIATYTLSPGADSTAVTLDAGGEQWLGFTVELPDGTNPSGLAQSTSAAWEMSAVSVDN
ncbi:SipW-dependent-type signal peptide-containing protein [Rhodococcus yananensis]|uniref:SipW-dependent-type signal peptide-containing protein n=2 Tax=Rhodococcus yananensis TaxID=2879464 RepID=UPI003EBA11F3